ncbi:RNAse P Rpr2/Rpp21 subunit domain-containing protein [Gaeumannomyces tritici R3-111a-1]|uniref:RNAse P Rpr2/Rpp21 subunit domain-containing protein n=1 Tax=Gaeumannomyces tritici (strain R3-111a-1) TaxID=644352 RepID=J3PK97_GAET3|nr:RNAse P Rpr2/Rpp21 subunit domain-containing protein [Gaeumannomyces tritici R3-111a-1]EJT68478.1 RNAse P Rpr2/Rpp21 subunit domain-containing protein [Gaeumannomyces tritici R3-111a-1]
MAKGAKRKAGSGVQNRPTYTRISFLYQAAALLASTRQQQPAKDPLADRPAPEKHDGQAGPADGSGSGAPSRDEEKHGDHRQLEGMSRRLLSDLRSVSLKSQIRLGPALKRTVCKFCDTLLVEGRSCTSTVENKSRGARKPWADVLVITCDTCGRAKRFPVAAPRQKRRPFRDATEEKAAGGAAGTTGQKTPPD